MKFEYYCEEDVRECVAYIDSDGTLVIKVDDGLVYMYTDETPNFATDKFKHELSTRKFYPGDTITITF